MIAPCPFTSKNSFVMKHSGKKEIPIFFLENPICFLNPIFFEHIPNSVFGHCRHTTFEKHTKSGVWCLYFYYFSTFFACEMGR